MDLLDLIVESLKLILVEPDYINSYVKLVYLIRTKGQKYYLLTFPQVSLQLQDINSFSEAVDGGYVKLKIKQVVELIMADKEKKPIFILEELNTDLINNCYKEIFSTKG